MHNKLVVADNLAALLGGRNIGDSYFGRSDDLNFVDTDILINGPLVPELSSGFDTYWNSRWSYPIEALDNFTLIPTSLDKVRKRISARLEDHPGIRGTQEQPGPVARLAQGAKLERATAIVDDPGVAWFDRPDEIAEDLSRIAASAAREVLVVSPYLIPTAPLLDIARQLTGRGIRIAVLTNSLASNDLVLANAGYSRSRQQILEAGIELYEMRADASLPGQGEAIRSLHAKYLVFDDELVFVGSLNLDPRSLYLNTELGVLLRSSDFASEMQAHFKRMTHPDRAWRVQKRTDEPGMQWQSSSGTLTHQPASRWKRLQSALMSLLPIKHQL